MYAHSAACVRTGACASDQGESINMRRARSSSFAIYLFYKLVYGHYTYIGERVMYTSTPLPPFYIL